MSKLSNKTTIDRHENGLSQLNDNTNKWTQKQGNNEVKKIGIKKMKIKNEKKMKYELSEKRDEKKIWNQNLINSNKKYLVFIYIYILLLQW